MQCSVCSLISTVLTYGFHSELGEKWVSAVWDGGLRRNDGVFRRIFETERRSSLRWTVEVLIGWEERTNFSDGDWRRTDELVIGRDGVLRPVYWVLSSRSVSQLCVWNQDRYWEPKPRVACFCVVNWYRLSLGGSRRCRNVKVSLWYWHCGARILAHWSPPSLRRRLHIPSFNTIMALSCEYYNM